MRSTWPSVSRSSSRPIPSHRIVSTPSRARSTPSISSRDNVGLRLGFSRHCSVVSSVPAPSVRIEPPSSTMPPSHHRIAQPLGDQPAHRGVAIPRRELPAPGVEAEVDRRAGAVVLDHVDRAAVAQPRVVERQSHDLHRRGAGGPRGGGVGARVGDHRHGLERADRVGHGRIVGPRLVHRLTPQVGAARPPHDRPLVGLPFGRCAHGSQSTRSRTLAPGPGRYVVVDLPLVSSGISTTTPCQGHQSRPADSSQARS